MIIKRNILTLKQQDDLIQWIKKNPESAWQFRHGAKHDSPSLLCFGYNIPSVKWKVGPTLKIPEKLVVIAEYLYESFGLCPPKSLQILISSFKPFDQIDPHTDAPLFMNEIVGLSLGGLATMDFYKKNEMELSKRYILDSGSAYLISDEMRYQWSHQILPVKEQRYSITFRGVENDT